MVLGTQVVDEVVREVVASALEEAARGGVSPLEVASESLLCGQELLVGERGRPARARWRELQQQRQRLARSTSREVGAIVEARVRRHADEIAGRFDPRTYALLTRALPPMIDLALGGVHPSRWRRLLAGRRDLDRHVVISGPTQRLQALQAKGTLVFTPTHASNLDSVLVGYALHRLSMAPVAYGAGLNVFSNPVLGWAIGRVGAFSIDRRERDPLYLRTLREYATRLVERGQGLLFFPGGTRSRSGAVERQVKKGLLGCVLEAYRRRRARGEGGGVFVVPVTISYPLVLEAGMLIDQYLSREGRHRCVPRRDESGRVDRWLSFARHLLRWDLRIHLRFGAPLDPFGNHVDDSGASLDPRGRALDPGGYLEEEGVVTLDPERDAEYTRALASRLVGAFHAGTVVQPTVVAAAAAFEAWRESQPEADLLGLVGTAPSGFRVETAAVSRRLQRLLVALSAAERAGRLLRASELARASPTEVLDAALRTFGTFHDRPVMRGEGRAIEVGDPRLLFYYRNRLEGFGLQGVSPVVGGPVRP